MSRTHPTPSSAGSVQGDSRPTAARALAWLRRLWPETRNARHKENVPVSHIDWDSREVDWLSGEDMTLERLLTLLRRAHFVVQSSPTAQSLHVWDCGLWLSLHIDAQRRLLVYSVWWRVKAEVPSPDLNAALLGVQSRRPLLRLSVTDQRELVADYAVPLEAGISVAQVLCSLRRVSHQASHAIEPLSARGWIV
jgi:hypothetical protein